MSYKFLLYLKFIIEYFFIALLLSLFDALKYEKILFDFSISPSSG